MRAILRRLPIIKSMAAIPNPNPSCNSIPNPNPKLRTVITNLRLYKPPPTSIAAAGDDDVDDRGKVFSQLGLAESSASSSIKTAESFRSKRAAVLICLFEGESGDLRVILTKRSSNLATHSGEVSLPGGKVEEEDVDDGATAVREAKEEIGLDPGLVNVVTVLEPFLSKHLYRVVPVIGILTSKEAFKPVVNTAEVEAIFDAPLEMFLKDENHRSEEQEWLGEKYLIHFFDFVSGTKKFVIWGLTASILIRAASVVYKRWPSFLEQEPKFSFPNPHNRIHSRH